MQIPAITYGGPKVPPEEPSNESVKLNESAVIVEFIAETFPESKLMPEDPVQRARARIFATAFEAKWFEALKNFLFGMASSAPLLEATEELQKLLPEAGYVVGEWSFADLLVLPSFARFDLLCRNEIGKYPLGEGKKVLDELASHKFARMRKYMDDLFQRPSFKATFDEVHRSPAINAQTVS